MRLISGSEIIIQWPATCLALAGFNPQGHVFVSELLASIATPYVRILGGGVVMGKYASSSYFWGGEWLEIGGNPRKKIGGT